MARALGVAKPNTTATLLVMGLPTSESVQLKISKSCRVTYASELLHDMSRAASLVTSNSVIDWLRSQTDEWDPCCRFPQNQQTRTPPPAQGGIYAYNYKPPMSLASIDLSNDNDSLSSSMTDTTRSMSLDALKRPKLKPKSPSRQAASRSPSPTRKLLALLKGASPSIKYCQSSSNIKQPEAVTSLRKRLATGLSQGVIPQSLRVRRFQPE